MGYHVQFIAHLIQADYTEYHIKVSSFSGESWLIRRRYSEFRELHDHLRLKFGDSLPAIPGKRLWGNQDPSFVKERQEGLQKYMDGVLALDNDCRTKFLRRFLEIRDLPNHPAPIGGATVSSRPSPSLPGASTTADAKKKAISLCEERLFNLSTSVALIDSVEEAERKKKYSEVLARLGGVALGVYTKPGVAVSGTAGLGVVVDLDETEAVMKIGTA